MARIHVQVPDELIDSIRVRLGPNINLAGIVESALIVLDTELKHDSRLAKGVRRLARLNDAIAAARAVRNELDEAAARAGSSS